MYIWTRDLFKVFIAPNMIDLSISSYVPVFIVINFSIKTLVMKIYVPVSHITFANAHF